MTGRKTYQAAKRRGKGTHKYRTSKQRAKIKQVKAKTVEFQALRKMPNGTFGYMLELGKDKVFVFSTLPIKNVQFSFREEK